MEVEKIVLDIIREMSQTEETDEELLDLGYLDKGLIDSFQIVEMIAKLEEKFGIHFSPEDLSSWEFRTLRGVAVLVKKKGEDVR